MKKKKIEGIIQKYLNNELNNEELNEFVEESSKEEIKSVFEDSVKINYLLSSKYTEIDSEKAYQDFVSRITPKEVSKPKLLRIGMTRIYKYAALLIVFIGVSYLTVQQFTKAPTSDIKLELKNASITLELENGDRMIIPDQGDQNIANSKGEIIGVQKGKELNYLDESKANSASLVYNKLEIPYGKTFQVMLSDGTRVHMNAGSSLRYPIKFIQGEDRQVFLNGEAYFEVAKDKNHPFIVNAKDINVLVTGTEFNVSCYKEDTTINTVLVEGSVHLYDEKRELYTKDSSLALNPGNLASWDSAEKKMEVSQVDTSIYTSWKDGILIFKHMKLSNILRKLERHYNLTIINKNQMLNDKVLTARFENASIEHVLESLKDIYFVDFNIVNNQIIIN